MMRIIREESMYPTVELHDPDERDEFVPDMLVWEGETAYEVPDEIVAMMEAAWEGFARAHEIYYRWEIEAGLRNLIHAYVPGWAEPHLPPITKETA